MMFPQRIECLVKPNEIAGNQSSPLVNQLIKRVLSVRTRLAPVDRPRLRCNMCSIKSYMFAVALHRQLLQIRWKPLKVLLIRQNRNRLRIEEIGVPDRQQTQQNRQVASERSRPEVFVHLMKASQHGAKIIRTNRQHSRQ